MEISKIKTCPNCNKESAIKVECLNSVEISLNAKRQYSGKVKVYAETIEKAMELSLLKAKELDIIIAERNGQI